MDCYIYLTPPPPPANHSWSGIFTREHVTMALIKLKSLRRKTAIICALEASDQKNM